MTPTYAQDGRTYSVGELAKLARVSVRTLHHYDAIGLLAPSERTAAGHRVYGRQDLETLQQILLFKELDLPLQDIRRVLLDPLFDRRAALTAQRRQLAVKARRTVDILAAIDSALAALKRGTSMTDEEMFEAFGAFDGSARRAQAAQRWDETGAAERARQDR